TRRGRQSTRSGTAFSVCWAWRSFNTRGCTTESDAALRQLIERGAGGAAFQIAEAYAYRGNADVAYEWLERAYAQRDAGIPFAKISIFLKNIQGDRRWRPFLEKL